MATDTSNPDAPEFDANDGDAPGPDHLTRADIEHISSCLGVLADLAEAVMMRYMGAPTPAAPPSTPGIIRRR